MIADWKVIQVFLSRVQLSTGIKNTGAVMLVGN